MERSKSGVPFKGGQEIHILMYIVLIKRCTLLVSLVVGMNLSTSQCPFIFFFCQLKQSITFRLIQCCFCCCFLGNYIYAYYNLNWHVFVLEPDDDVYREVLQSFMKMGSLNANTMVPSPIVANSPPQKRAKVALEYE